MHSSSSAQYKTQYKTFSHLSSPVYSLQRHVPFTITWLYMYNNIMYKLCTMYQRKFLNHFPSNPLNHQVNWMLSHNLKICLWGLPKIVPSPFTLHVKGILILKSFSPEPSTAVLKVKKSSWIIFDINKVTKQLMWGAQIYIGANFFSIWGGP